MSRNFFQQAAKASFLAPLLALGLGITTGPVVKNEPMIVKMVPAIINSILIVGGFVLAIIALIGMRRHGRQGILGSALGGLIGNGLVLAAVGVTVFMYSRMAASDLRPKLVGHWVTQLPTDRGPVPYELRLEQEGTFRAMAEQGNLIDISGRWSVEKRRITLNIESVKVGDTNKIGAKVALHVSRVSPTGLTIKTQSGEEEYRKK